MDAVKEKSQSAQEEPEAKQEIADTGDVDVKQESVKADEGTVSDSEVRERLLLLLGQSDLATTTEKKLRKQLELEFGVKLADRKSLIREEVLAYLARKQEEEGVKDKDGADASGGDGESEGDEEEEAAAAVKPKKRRGAALGSVLSEPLQAFLGAESMPRPQVVKAIWAYIRENKLQDPSNKRKIILDDKLSTIFTAPVDMFSMNKQLSRHCKTNDAASGDDDVDDEPRQRPAKKAKKAASSSRAAANGKSDGAKRKPSGFCKPIRLSDELASVTGEREMNRGAVMKWMYDYAKSNELMDPSDKRYIIADDTLKNLTGESRFLAFGAQKLFSKHFLK